MVVAMETAKTNLQKRKKTMKRNSKATFFLTLAAVITMFFAVPALSQDKPDNDMQILRDKIKADKKLLVASNMGLTESQAKGFWPVYDAYQKDLTAINQRMVGLILSYARDYDSNTFTDEKAKKLTADFLGIQKAEANLQASYASKLSEVLPPKQVLRYLQIENKIRAVIKYELAAEIPLVD
jgi:Spy/CpxP family protein refolding chaperone